MEVRAPVRVVLARLVFTLKPSDRLFPRTFNAATSPAARGNDGVLSGNSWDLGFGHGISPNRNRHGLTPAGVISRLISFDHHHGALPRGFMLMGE